MSETIEQRLRDLGVALPVAATPAANYLPYCRADRLLFIAGQLPRRNGQLLSTGLLGRDLDTATGSEAARQCAINILAHAKAAVDDLENISRLVKITIYVASAPGFIEQHLVANGASDFLVAVLGDRGSHARSAIGAASLPLNSAVEVDAVFESNEPHDFLPVTRLALAIRKVCLTVIGRVFLGEKLTPRRIGACAIVALGAICIGYRA